MTIQEMKQRKKELGYSNAQIAKLSGIPLGTVQKVFSGVTSSPRYGTLCALERILKEPSSPCQDLVSESAFPYMSKKQGKYTLEDYYQIPDEQRVELIDGVIYDMSAPTLVHQLIAGLIYAKLLAYISGRKGKCLPIISPIDVQLDCDDKTMVQPDLIIVCDRDRLINRCVYGSPDFIIEILSPSTRKKDMVTKLNKYMNAGVREYWMVDPDKRNVIVYDFEHDNYPSMYGFDAKIPVGIWDGDCEIDFQEVYEYIRFLYEKSPY